MAVTAFHWTKFLIRLVVAFVLLFATYNPSSGHSWVHWFIESTNKLDFLIILSAVILIYRLGHLSAGNGTLPGAVWFTAGGCPVRQPDLGDDLLRLAVTGHPVGTGLCRPGAAAPAARRGHILVTYPAAYHRPDRCR